MINLATVFLRGTALDSALQQVSQDEDSAGRVLPPLLALVARFGAGQQLTPTAPPTCPGGICVPPTPLPTPTPPPPPPVPPASLATRLALHSRYDPVSNWSGTTEGQQSATDAVNISQNLHVVWPMGEPLDWTPRVTLTPIPEQVITDPWCGQIRYSYEQTIEGWNYGGSVGQTTATTGCHGGTMVPFGEGSGCRYAYLSDGELNETTIRGQAHVLWSLRPLVEPGDPALYRYRLLQERGADLQFDVVGRVTQLRNGMPYRTQLSVVPVSALVDLAVVRSVR